MQKKARKLAPENKEHMARCRDDFAFFCSQYVYVEDKETHVPVKFKLWPAQERIAKMLVEGKSLDILKARRLGITWLLCAYAVWLTVFRGNQTVVVLNQSKEYAQDFLDRARMIYHTLPEWMDAQPVTNNRCRLEFATGSLLRSVACTRGAIRSLAADLVIFDEAAYQRYFREARQAAQPAVETGNGQIVVLSTSAGPQGDFYKLWNECKLPQSKYAPVFLHWREHPRRNDEWYNREAGANASDPAYMKREYPSTPEEAFECAAGRVYSYFTESGEAGKRYICELPVRPEYRKYRAIDWGGVDPLVCLWGCVIPGDGLSLTIDPSCKHTINELLAYSYDSAGRPNDHDNHACDCIRYMVITPGRDGIRGHLHIYRELYIPDSARKGISLGNFCKRIREFKEEIKETIADRSRPDSINELEQHGIRPVQKQRHLGGEHADELAQGIGRVSELLFGTINGSEASPYPKERKSGGMLTVQQRGLFA